MSRIAGVWCKTVSFNPVDTRLPKLSFGAWHATLATVRNDGEDGEAYLELLCGKYPNDSDMDINWRVARVSSLLAQVLGAVLTMALIFAPCDAPRFCHGNFWRNLSIFAIAVMPLVQGLTFSILFSNVCINNDIVNVTQEAISTSSYGDVCEWDIGLSMSVVACLLWSATGGYMLLIGPPSVFEPTWFEQRTIKHWTEGEGGVDEDRWERHDL